MASENLAPLFEILNTPLNLNAHIVRIHKPYECLQCGKTFHVKDGLRHHMRIHDEHKPFTCEIYCKQFKLVRILRNHMKVHSGESHSLANNAKEDLLRKSIYKSIIRIIPVGRVRSQLDHHRLKRAFDTLHWLPDHILQSEHRVRSHLDHHRLRRPSRDRLDV